MYAWCDVCGSEMTICPSQLKMTGFSLYIGYDQTEAIPSPNKSHSPGTGRHVELRCNVHTP